MNAGIDLFQHIVPLSCSLTLHGEHVKMNTKVSVILRTDLWSISEEYVYVRMYVIHMCISAYSSTVTGAVGSAG